VAIHSIGLRSASRKAWTPERLSIRRSTDKLAISRPFSRSDPRAIVEHEERRDPHHHRQHSLDQEQPLPIPEAEKTVEMLHDHPGGRTANHPGHRNGENEK
jgi:hypothetical protein